jgi:hypothetical protein
VIKRKRKKLNLRLKIIYIAVFSFPFLSCDRESDKAPLENNEMIISREDLDHIEREDVSAAGSITLTKGEIRGMKLFMKNCNRCHPAGEKGKGPSLVDKKIPDFVVHFQVRQGLGDMPAFKKEDISKEDVKKIILFVRLLRSSYEAENQK